MEKTFSSPPTMAAPAARYAHAVRAEIGAGALIFLSGQLGQDADGNPVGPGDTARQAEQAFDNMQTVLEANGATMRDVVKTTTYLTDIADLATVNAVRNRRFPDTTPTSTTVQVHALASPQLLVEIEAIAVT